ncbi:hypothetical protein V19_03 [Brucella phage V_19]|uniref:Uncharacterized protein n=30 Tax=Perisivirus TaxID=1984798 RepID=H2EI40_9CAUD|nr:hypothetical protein F354_gp03 [Brucella phage Tb]YP_007002069.1 hypothetical protein F355_gp03 [Brucella phage Pr]AHB81063.1 hypothetical protein Bk_03 [Brucella phage Bk]AHB81119.1 hypothetical protein Fz_03 [Brucella phage Fz]AHB81177.1 hypothetical protein R/C_03 [Brucella phage R/C]AHB81233.1 hypothetical protein S708_03 [Brucella phage S708]AHB81347.1 hypothetical protein Wb_03 [Brucella phage Wb]AKO58991.1 hypothetical protein p0219_03 [Brucella phage 02_19]AKO59049.1 hypothetical
MVFYYLEDNMTYSPEASRKGGSRKHLVEVLIREVEAHKHGKHSAECMGELIIAVRKYQKETAK